jgi:hypothetical protein
MKVYVALFNTDSDYFDNPAFTADPENVIVATDMAALEKAVKERVVGVITGAITDETMQFSHYRTDNWPQLDGYTTTPCYVPDPQPTYHPGPNMDEITDFNEWIGKLANFAGVAIDIMGPISVIG